ncbi:hypothetical protein [Pararhizobium sp. PWRC1-1]|uniref:hypothetical protein n=1 Tax=Pararhizobium sp. PWRC1-1 TaxID=2804566 RepID=UPI003CFAA0C5
MHDDDGRKPRSLMISALGGVGLLLCVAGFLGWIVQGPEMLLTMAENGISWCF